MEQLSPYAALFMASPMEESPNKVPSSKRKTKEKFSNSTGKQTGAKTEGKGDLEMEGSFQNQSNDSTPETKLNVGYVQGLKNHTSEVSNLSSPTSNGSSKKKSGSESSGGGAQGVLSTNSTYKDGIRRIPRSGRGFSSGSSDGEETGEDGKQKAPPPLPRRMKGGKVTKPSPLDSDDESTDSADEGNSGEEEGERRAREQLSMSGLRRSQRSISRKNSSESTNSATSPINTTHSTSTIFVESALPKESLIGPNGVAQPSSPVNMAVGYGAGDCMAAPSVFGKTPPTQSPLDTPTGTSPKITLEEQGSPGTPIHISPDRDDAEVQQVCWSM